MKDPTSFEASVEKGTLFVGETTKVLVTCEEDVAMTFRSLTPEIVSVDADGVVTALGGGTGTIAVSPMDEDDNVKEVSVEILAFQRLSGYTQNFTEADGILTSHPIEAGVDNPHAYLMSTTKGTKYYAEATISILNHSNDGWARAGIGHATDDQDGNGRAFFFSPMEGQKSVMMDVPNNWGAVTAQTMIWQVNGLSAVNPADFTLGVLRDGNESYYTIDGRLAWYEQTTRFDNIETSPTVIAKDAQIEVTDFTVTTDEATLEEKINSAEYQKKLFNAANEGFVEFESDEKFTFVGMNDGNAFYNNNSVRAYGEKGLLSGSFQIDFDLFGIATQADNDDNNRIGVGLRRVATDPAIVDSFTMTSDLDLNAYDYGNWTWDGHTFWQRADKLQTTSDKETREGHYRLVRTVEEGAEAAHFSLYHEDLETPVMEVDVPYVGDYIISFGGNYANGTFDGVGWMMI